MIPREARSLRDLHQDRGPDLHTHRLRKSIGAAARDGNRIHRRRTSNACGPARPASAARGAAGHAAAPLSGTRMRSAFRPGGGAKTCAAARVPACSLRRVDEVALGEAHLFRVRTRPAARLVGQLADGPTEYPCAPLEAALKRAPLSEVYPDDLQVRLGDHEVGGVESSPRHIFLLARGPGFRPFHIPVSVAAGDDGAMTRRPGPRPCPSAGTARGRSTARPGAPEMRGPPSGCHRSVIACG